MPNAPSPDTNERAAPDRETKPAPEKALREQQKRELPSNDWPGKGAA